MIGRIGCVEILELAIAPIVIATIDNDAADGRPMATDKFSCAVCNDMRAPFKRTTKIRCGKRIVDEQDELMFLRNFSHFLKREYSQVRITQRFPIKNLGVRLDRFLKVLWLAGVDECDINSKLRKRILELIVCSPV